MRTSQHPLLETLGRRNVLYVIPAYQRTYAWKQRQCEELWLDVHRAARGRSKHFCGTLLYAMESPSPAGRERRAVVDGQQRLTTLTLMIVALSRYLRRHNTCLEGGALTADDLETRYLSLPDEPLPCKLVLSRDDRDTLAAVIANNPLPGRATENITANLALFENLMDRDDFDPALFWEGLGRLYAITAQVDEADSAQLIFESLNSKGMPLTTADLVRNYLLLAETHEEQTRLYDEYWAPIEEMFAPDPGSLRLDNGIQGWLSVRFRKVRAHGAKEVYGVFKRYVEDDYTGTTEDLLRELRGFCLVWAENYRYHAVKKFRSNSNWAVNGAPTLVSHYERKACTNENYAKKVRADLNATDASW